MKLHQLYEKNEPIISLEVFPPKKESGLHTLQTMLDQVKTIQPAYISVTYGAGGTSVNNQTLEIAQIIKETQGIEKGTVYIFPKLDGTNGVVWFDGIDVKAGSRNRELGLGKEDNYGFNQHIQTNKEKYLAFFNFFPTAILYGEWHVLLQNCIYCFAVFIYSSIIEITVFTCKER